MDDELIDALRDAMGEQQDDGKDFQSSHGIKLDLTWRPRLNPTQQKVFDSKAKYILSYGERGTGKSVVALHKLVDHCVRNKNAFALIIVREVGVATEGGSWHKLQTEVLPQWERGNFDRKTRKRLDNGCGIKWTPPKLDPQDKKPYIWISGVHGWSQIKLISLFVGEHVSDKVRGKEPSAVFFDEAQTTDSPNYFNDIVQQIGRRPDIEDQQFICYACNPKGPSHWLYHRFFLSGYSEDGEPIEWPIDQETGHPIRPDGKPATEYGVFHVPISENKHNLPPGYWENVLEAVKNDPIEHDRMVLGLWVDKPEGDSLFGGYWHDAIHLRGDLNKSTGIVPAVGYPLIISWDPGAAHTSIHFEQYIPTKDKIIWAVIDEMNYVGKYMPYRQLVPKVVARMQYWEKRASDEAGKEVRFNFIHVSDDSAFNQFRAKEGSFDAQDIETISREYVDKLKAAESDEQKKSAFDRFIIRMKPAPKGQHSVEARVRIVTDLLVEQSIIVSATCVKTRAMFMNLECDKDNRMKPKRSAHLHPFDSLSYSIIYFNSGAGRLVTQAQLAPPEKQEFYRVGG